MELFLIPAYAAANRLWGAAHPAFRGKKALIFLGLSALGFAVGWIFALAGLLWCAYRSSGYPDAPRTRQEYAEASLLHLIGGVILLLPCVMYGQWFTAASQALAYWVARVGVSAWYGERVRQAEAEARPVGRENVWIEIGTGALFGLGLFKQAYDAFH